MPGTDAPTGGLVAPMPGVVIDLRAAVGDRVEVEQMEDGSCRIDAVLPRSSVLSRRSFAKRREQVLAAKALGAGLQVGPLQQLTRRLGAGASHEE